MSSFYGGKQGRTYHIVQRYDSVEQMVQCFNQGGAYVAANYGEYVLIDTPSKNNPENGLLYRRGFDFNTEYNTNKPIISNFTSTTGSVTTTDLEGYREAWQAWIRSVGGGAEYVGQIVGPDGKVSLILITDWDNLISILDEEQGYGASSTANVKDSPGIHYNLQAGEYEYNDTIKAGYVNVLEEETGLVTGCFISFDFPYNIFNITAQSVDPYGDEILLKYNIEGTTPPSTYQIGATYENNKWKYDGLIYELPGSAEHPFFHNFDIAIPKGIHGQNVELITIETLSSTNTNGFTPENYPNLVLGNQYYTYTIKNFDGSAAGASTAHLGAWPYRVIDNVTVQRDNRDRNLYPEGSSTVLQGQIKLLSESQASPETKAIICVKTGNYNSEIESLFDNAEIGDIIPAEASSEEAVWLVTNVPTAAAANLIYITFTAGASIQTSFRQIDYLWVDDSGKMFVIYSDAPTVAYYLTLVNSIDSITRGDDGLLYISYKNGYGDTFYIKEISSITLSPDITQDQDIIANYIGVEDGSPSLIIGTLNNLLDIQRYGDNILILYSDPRVRDAIPQHKRRLMDWYQEWDRDNIDLESEESYYSLNTTTNQYEVISDIDAYEGTIYKKYSNLIWYNFGQLGAQYHVMGEYTYEDILTGSLVNGFGNNNDEDRMGWLVTIPVDILELIDGETITKTIQKVYAYDYNDSSESGNHIIDYNDTRYNTKWYEITSLADAVTPPNAHIIVALETDQDITTKTEKLKVDGLWFVLSEGHHHGGN